MTPEAVIALLAEYALPDLLKLGRALYDLIESKANAQSVAAAEVVAGEAAADAAEAAKFGPAAP